MCDIDYNSVMADAMTSAAPKMREIIIRHITAFNPYLEGADPRANEMMAKIQNGDDENTRKGRAEAEAFVMEKTKHLKFNEDGYLIKDET